MADGFLLNKPQNLYIAKLNLKKKQTSQEDIKTWGRRKEKNLKLLRRMRYDEHISGYLHPVQHAIKIQVGLEESMARPTYMEVFASCAEY